jgi:hypothetical protein
LKTAGKRPLGHIPEMGIRPFGACFDEYGLQPVLKRALCPFFPI